MKYFFQALFCLIPLPAWSASFDCDKASTQIEQLLCRDADLSQLDEQMADAYQNALVSSPNATVLRTEQKVWLNTARDRCRNARCLRLAYLNRILALNSARVAYEVSDQPIAKKQNQPCEDAMRNADLDELMHWPSDGYTQIVPLRIQRKGVNGCQWILVGQGGPSPRLALVALVNQVLVVLAEGRIPKDASSPDNVADELFRAATPFKFPNGVSSIRLHTTWVKGGGGFGLSSDASHYVRRAGSKLTVILSAFEDAESFYLRSGDEGQGCTDQATRTATLRFSASTTKGWPDAYLQVRSKEFVECENPARSAPVVKPRVKHYKEKLQWDGTQYHLVRKP